MKSKILVTLIAMLTAYGASAQLESFKINDEWVNKIEQIAPEKPANEPQKSRKILVLDRFTGFDHWVTPHTSQVIKVLGKKSGAYETTITKDLLFFDSKILKKYDAVVLNNNCSKGPRRNQILDMLEEDTSLNEEEKRIMASELEENLIEYVEKGGGLVVVHGGIVMQNNSIPFSEMVGGSFDYHPPQQEVTIELAEPDHPLCAAFGGASFTHVDEPYFFKNAYTQKNFRPLLYMDVSKLKKVREPEVDKIKYVSWIKPHGKGRVFYVSPSHNAQSFEDVRLLKFILDGTQYVLGDLNCDDSPIN
jgi:type 1 glutamine amidotransferase